MGSHWHNLSHPYLVITEHSQLEKPVISITFIPYCVARCLLFITKLKAQFSIPPSSLFYCKANQAARRELRWLLPWCSVVTLWCTGQLRSSVCSRCCCGCLLWGCWIMKWTHSAKEKILPTLFSWVSYFGSCSSWFKIACSLIVCPCSWVYVWNTFWNTCLKDLSVSNYSC